jgi:hypothetical protein
MEPSHFKGKMSSQTRTPTIWAARAAILLPLALTGCHHAHIINTKNARACELQGFPPGTDANADCAAKLDAEDQLNDDAPESSEHAVGTPVEALPPPPHAGGVSQIISLTAAPGTATTVAFAVSVDPDCNVAALPTIKIEKQPAHGNFQSIRRDDYVRLSRTGFPPACAEKKVAGVGLDYTPAYDYTGHDVIEFQIAMKAGSVTSFKVLVTVTKKPPQAGSLD